MAKYSFFRFTILDNVSDNRYAGIREFELREEVGGSNVLSTANILNLTTDCNAFISSWKTDLFDGVYTGTNGWGSGDSLPISFTVEIENGITPEEYAIGSYPTGTSTRARSPSTWRVEASEDGSTWIILNEQTGLNWDGIDLYAPRVFSADQAFIDTLGAETTLSSDTFSISGQDPIVQKEPDIDYSNGVFSFTPSIGPTVTDPDGPDLINFDTWVAGIRRESDPTMPEIDDFRPSWLNATLSKKENQDGSWEGEVQFSIDRSGFGQDVEVIKIGCYISDGVGESIDYFYYWPEKDLALHNIMGQEDKYRPDPIGGGNARAVIAANETSIVRIWWGLYEEGVTTKDNLQKFVPFSSLNEIHEITWSGLSVDATYGFYVEALTPHGQRRESGIYTFTTGGEIVVEDPSFETYFGLGWGELEKKYTTQVLPDNIAQTGTPGVEHESGPTGPNLEINILSGPARQIVSEVKVNDFDTNISTTTSHTIP